MWRLPPSRSMVVYNAAIGGWADSGDPTAGGRAETLLNDIERRRVGAGLDFLWGGDQCVREWGARERGAVGREDPPPDGASGGRRGEEWRHRLGRTTRYSRRIGGAASPVRRGVRRGSSDACSDPATRGYVPT